MILPVRANDTGEPVLRIRRAPAIATTGIPEANQDQTEDTSIVFRVGLHLGDNPGLIRDDTPGCGNSSIMTTTTAPGEKSNMSVTKSHPGIWTRTIEVYVPPNYVRGTEAPFIVIGDVVGERDASCFRPLHDRVGHCLAELTSLLDAWQGQDRANPRLQLFRRVDAASFDNLLPAFLEPRQLPPDFRRNVVRSRA